MLHTNNNIVYKGIRIFKLEAKSSKKLSPTIKLMVNIKANLEKKRNEKDKRVLFIADVLGQSKESNEVFLKMEAACVFAFKQIPEDYQNAIENEIVPLLQDNIIKKVNSLLKDMGLKGIKSNEESD